MSAPGEAAPPMSGYERLKRLRARRRADGLRELVLWLPPDLHAAVQAHAAELLRQRADAGQAPGAGHTPQARRPAAKKPRRPAGPAPD